MFEYHGWVVLESTTGRRLWKPDGLYYPDDERLHRELDLLIDQFGLREWVYFHHSVNGLHSLTLSGLRNHRDPRIFDLFAWLAANAKRSYGLLFTRNVEDDDRSYDPETEFRVFRLSCGEFLELHQLVEIPQNSAIPLTECEGFGES